MAGMHAAGTQIDHEIEMVGAAGAGGDRRDLGHHARPVAGDQHVGGQPVGVFGDELAQAGRTAFLAGFQDQLQVEAQCAAAFGQHGFQRGQVQGVLALVVGGAAAVPAVGFLGQHPGRQARAPLVLQAADGVAVAVGQDGRAVRALQPFGEQDRAEAGVPGWGGSRRVKPMRSSQGWMARGQIALDVGLVAGVLGGAGDRHQFRKVVAEAVRSQSMSVRAPGRCPAMPCPGPRAVAATVPDDGASGYLGSSGRGS